MKKERSFEEENIKRLWVLLRFIITFLALSIFLHLLISLNFDLYWLRRLYTFAAYYLLKPFISIMIQGTTMTTSLKGQVLIINISKDCTGWKSLIALLALILSTPPSFIKSKKAYFFIFLAPFIVFLITIIRILSSILLSLLTSPNYFDIIHGMLWKTLSLLIAIGVWWEWLRANRRVKELDEKSNKC